MLVLPNKDVWTFDAYEDGVEIEESVYLAGPDGPRRTLQIVIYGQRPQGPARAMDASRAVAPPRPGPAARAGRAELPL